MAARFTDMAVDALADYVEANYATYLDAVETELSLTAGTLPDPTAYYRADLPLDNHNPRVDVFEESWSFVDDGDDLMVEVVCSVLWSYLGDADRAAGELMARRCLTAMIKCLWASRTLSGTVKAIYLGSGSAASVDESNGTRHGFLQTVTVALHEVM